MNNTCTAKMCERGFRGFSVRGLIGVPAHVFARRGVMVT